MPIDALPSISRSDTDFRTKVDDYFLTKLPTFSTQAEEARLQIVAAESTTKSAASTASTDANTATTAANTATSARDSAVAAKNSAETAAAQAVSGNVATPIHEAVSKTTPVDADELGLSDSAASWGLKKLTFANLKAWIGSLFVSKAGDTMTGDLNFSGTARRITGDFSNATVANRVIFQTTSANANTTVSTIPSGSATTSGFLAFNGQDPTNTSEASLLATSTDVRVSSTIRGTGAYLPLTFYTNGLERLRIDTSGNVIVTGGGALGYGTGSGGTATQPTNKGTSVTLNKPSGYITTFAGSIAANSFAAFQVVNSTVSDGDTVTVNLVGGVASGTSYMIDAQAPGAGSFYIIVRNVTGAATSSSDAPTIQFNVHKGARS